MFDDDKNKQNEEQNGGNNKKAGDIDSNNSANNQVFTSSEQEKKNAVLRDAKLENENKAGESAFKKEENKVEDILADIDVSEEKEEKPAVFQPKQPEAGDGQIEQKNADSDNSGEKLKKLFALIVIVCVLALLGVLAVWGYNKYFKQEETLLPEASERAGDEQPENIDSAEQPAAAPKKPDMPVQAEPEKATPLDTDKDGLSDDEEKKLGTDINKVDSDNDELFDLEEVKVYKTNPMNSDTDGDGFLDGAEVKDGYNPNGAGKLYEIKK